MDSLNVDVVFGDIGGPTKGGTNGIFLCLANGTCGIESADDIERLVR